MILVLSILSFSSAIVASSYAFTCLLSDQLSGQLLCMISTVTGGVFLKLFLDRHQGQYVFIKGYFSWVLTHYYSLTHSLTITHSLTHSLTITHYYSLTHSLLLTITHSLTHPSTCH